MRSQEHRNEFVKASPPLRSTNFVHTAIDTRAHKGYRGTRPTFTDVGHNVLYRWTDVLKLLAHNTFHRTDNPR